MLTIKYLIANKFKLNHVLTDEDKKQLLLENKDNNYSYLSLMKEMFSYKNITVADLLHGWSGVKLVTVWG